MAAVREGRNAQGLEQPRSELVEIQRARITAAMAELVCERGAGGMTVAHIVGRSGVSRRTFYEFFADREDCHVAALDHALARAAAAVRPAFAAPGAWQKRVRAALAALLAFLDDEPALGYLCVVGSLSGGPRTRERRAAATEALVVAVHEGRRVSRARRAPDQLVAEGLVGAVLAILAARLQEEDRSPLLPLLNRLTAMVVLPYLGARAAEGELERPTPRPRPVKRPRRDPLREVDMRLTYRTVRVLHAIASSPESNNRQVAEAAGIADQGQISRLLARLQALGLIANAGGDHARGEPNAWELTAKGHRIAQSLRPQAA